MVYRRNSKVLLIFFLIALVITAICFVDLGVIGEEDVYNLTLLAVQEFENGDVEGSTADLKLELAEGKGRVFLQTIPLTKIDTQFSTRYAKEIACYQYDLDCSKYDFFYTIESDSSIIGGPSAGAALSVLTAMAVMDLEYDEKIVITGTINSGGTVGPVGGVKEKIEGAAKDGFEKVLVPLGSLNQEIKINEIYGDIGSNGNIEEKINGSTNGSTDESNGNEIFPLVEDPFNFSEYAQNDTVTLKEYAELKLGVEAIEVADLDQVLFEFAGYEVDSNDYSFDVDNQYLEIMEGLDFLLCERAESLQNELFELWGIDLNDIGEGSEEFDHLDENKSLVYEEIESRWNNSNTQRLVGSYYSSASTCFGLSYYLRDQIYLNKGLTNLDILFEIQSLNEEYGSIFEDLEAEEVETISDLQTKIVVSQRLNDAKTKTLEIFEGLNKSHFQIFNESDLENQTGNNTNLIIGEDYFLSLEIEEEIEATEFSARLAYAKERMYSARTWLEYFKMQGKELQIDGDTLENVCSQKIIEGDERYSYAAIYLSQDYLESMGKKLDSAVTAQEEGDFILCIAQAVQAKADGNLILGSPGIDSGVIEDYLAAKHEAVLTSIAKNSEEGVFPILGYSYMQFAQSLAENKDFYSALMYFEYALEMSELDIYFPEEKSASDKFFGLNLNGDAKNFLVGFFNGLVVGVFLLLIISRHKRKGLEKISKKK